MIGLAQAGAGNADPVGRGLHMNLDSAVDRLQPSAKPRGAGRCWRLPEHRMDAWRYAPDSASSCEI
jgi:hypothetical protein